MKSSITTCPHCATQFVVDDAQLSQYNGKVRCGHCLNVFNAVDYIAPTAADKAVVQAPVIEQAKQPEPEVVDSPSIKPVTSEPVVDLSSIETNTPKPQSEPEVVITSEAPVTVTENLVTEESDVHEVVEAFVKDEEQVDQAFIDKTQSLIENINIHDVESELEPEPEASKESLVESVDASTKIELTSPVVEEVNEYADYDLPQEPNFSDNSVITEIGNTTEASIEENVEQEYEFLAEKTTTSPWLKVLALLFILILIGQFIYFMRHTIAQEFPATKPMLQSVCKPLGCEINLPKEIQLFSIDDSGIQEDSEYQGVIRLTSTITNRANFNQAYPNLEVTLTDAKDVPKIRRTFTPEEYLVKEEFSEQGLSSGDSISVDMPLMADDVKVAGFRILLTY